MTISIYLNPGPRCMFMVIAYTNDGFPVLAPPVETLECYEGTL